MKKNITINAYYSFKIKTKKKYGYKFYKIKKICNHGRNKIFDDLLQSKYLHHFRPVNMKKADPNGEYSGAIEYNDPEGQLCLLSFMGNVQGFDTGVVQSTVSNNDCILFNVSSQKYIEVYIINDSGKEAYDIAYDYGLGLLEATIREFHRKPTSSDNL